MVNDSYTPSDAEETILELLQEGRESNEPWGRANPMYVRERTDLNKQQTNYALKQLVSAGWIEKKTDGLYEFVADPRDE
jgi:DNA-binding IclR family transcriptional regulator